MFPSSVVAPSFNFSAPSNIAPITLLTSDLCNIVECMTSIFSLTCAVWSFGLSWFDASSICALTPPPVPAGNSFLVSLGGFIPPSNGVTLSLTPPSFQVRLPLYQS